MSYLSKIRTEMKWCMSSLMAKFKKEYFGVDTLEDENGFATFIIQPPSVYIEDVYVVPEKRNSHIATSYANAIARWAIEQGCTTMISTVNLNGLTPDRSMKVLLAYGLKPAGVKDNVISFIKELKKEST